MDRAQSLQKLLYLSQQVEIFVISTYPAETSSEDEEVQLLKLAHNFFPEIDIYNYSRGVSCRSSAVAFVAQSNIMFYGHSITPCYTA